MSTDAGKSGRKSKSEEEKQSDLLERQKYCKKISKRITNLIASHHVLQQDVADYLGMSKQAFSAYMKAKSHFFSIQMLHKIADYFHCDVDYLIRRQDAPNHEAADPCKYTGLSSETVELLHDAVEHGNEYRLLIDIFGYMLNQYKVYRVSDTITQTGVPKLARIDNDMVEMMDNVVSAIRAIKKPIITTLLEAHKATHGDTDDEDPADTLYQYLKIEEFLWNHGGEVISADDASKFYFREASEAFIKVLLAFLNDQGEQNPEFFIQKLIPTGRIKAEDIESFQKTGEAASYYYYRAHSVLADLMLDPVENDASEEE